VRKEFDHNFRLGNTKKSEFLLNNKFIGAGMEGRKGGNGELEDLLQCDCLSSNTKQE